MLAKVFSFLFAMSGLRSEHASGRLSLPLSCLFLPLPPCPNETRVRKAFFRGIEKDAKQRTEKSKVRGSGEEGFLEFLSGLLHGSVFARLLLFECL